MTTAATAADPGVVYLLHFNKPIGGPGRNGAQHYTGWTPDLDARLAEHAAGRGASITAYVAAQGIGWVVARIWEGDRHLERRLKNHGAARRCPLCKAARTGR